MLETTFRLTPPEGYIPLLPEDAEVSAKGRFAEWRIERVIEEGALLIRFHCLVAAARFPATDYEVFRGELESARRALESDVTLRRQ